MQFLLQFGVFLSHFFVLGLPLAVGCFQCLDLSLVVTSLNIGLTEPFQVILVSHKSILRLIIVGGGITSHWSHANSCLLPQPPLQVFEGASARLHSEYHAGR